MKTIKTLGIAMLFSALSTAALADTQSNGADGWRKLQSQQGTQQTQQQTDSSRASADAYAAQAIASNPSNYNVR